VGIRDDGVGILLSSEIHIPVRLSLILLSDVTCLTSECCFSLLGADDEWNCHLELYQNLSRQNPSNLERMYVLSKDKFN
jgi:hypothetical protein